MKLTENQRVARNPVTGDPLESRMPTDEYRAGWDRIFGKKKQQEEDRQEKNNESGSD